MVRKWEKLSIWPNCSLPKALTSIKRINTDGIMLLSYWERTGECRNQTKKGNICLTTQAQANTGSYEWYSIRFYPFDWCQCHWKWEFGPLRQLCLSSLSDDAYSNIIAFLPSLYLFDWCQWHWQWAIGPLLRFGHFLTSHTQSHQWICC